MTLLTWQLWLLSPCPGWSCLRSTLHAFYHYLLGDSCFRALLLPLTCTRRGVHWIRDCSVNKPKALLHHSRSPLLCPGGKYIPHSKADGF